jgi:hypothetical protein
VCNVEPEAHATSAGSVSKGAVPVLPRLPMTLTSPLAEPTLHTALALIEKIIIKKNKINFISSLF